jgi:hypothetical protein
MGSRDTGARRPYTGRQDGGEGVSMAELPSKEKRMPVIEIPLSEELLQRLDERAREVGGKDRAEYIRSLIQRDVEGNSSLDEILHPFRQEVKASGMSDEELASLFEDAREEAWQERQAGERRGE